ncbi:MAG: tyrosine-type recombinase/integrase [Polyangiaceae bacterium]
MRCLEHAIKGKARRPIKSNARTLVVRRTKFGKDRLVPFSPRLAREFEAYLAMRHRGRTPLNASVLPGVRGAAVSTNSMRRVFGRLCREVGVGASHSGAPPRVHDLRHSFAVATLLHWYEAGINLSGKLLHLSTFLGHSKIKATAVYLTTTWELLREARNRFARVAATAIPEVAS